MCMREIVLTTRKAISQSRIVINYYHCKPPDYSGTVKQRLSIYLMCRALYTPPPSAIVTIYIILLYKMWCREKQKENY